MTTSITKTQVLEGWTLATLADDDEPRVRDIELAERLGFERPRKIRDLIKRLRLDGFLNDSDVRPIVGRGEFGRRPAEELYLTELGAVLVAMRSETTKGRSIARQIASVFVAYRRGAIPPTVAPRGSNTASIGDSPEALDRLRLAARRVNRARGYSIAKVYGFLRKSRKVNSPFAIAVGDIQSVLNDLERIERSVLSLGSGRAPKQLPLNTAQASFKWN